MLLKLSEYTNSDPEYSKQTLRYQILSCTVAINNVYTGTLMCEHQQK